MLCRVQHIALSICLVIQAQAVLLKGGQYSRDYVPDTGHLKTPKVHKKEKKQQNKKKKQPHHQFQISFSDFLIQGSRERVNETGSAYVP